MMRSTARPGGKTVRFGRLKAVSDEMLHVDLIRFIASAGIVFHHSHEFLTPLAERATVMRQSTGLALLVDLFFFISGLVIASVYADRVGSTGQVLRFWQRRIARLVPLHWLVLACSIATWAVLLQFADGNTTPSFAPHCIAANALFLSGLFGICGPYQFNGVTWSIGAEMVMYLIFPLIALVIARARHAPIALGVAVLLLNFALFAIPPAGVPGAWTALHPVLRALPPFLIGAGIAAIRLPAIPYGSVVLTGLTVVMLACMMVGAPLFVQLALVYAVGICAAAADRNGRAGRVVRAVAPLGQLTYSLYMWHSLAILVIINALGDKLLRGGPALMIGLTLLCYAVLGIWSYISFEFIETPARRWVDRLFHGSPRFHGVKPTAGGGHDGGTAAQP